jgi:hypothetical protein
MLPPGIIFSPAFQIGLGHLGGDARYRVVQSAVWFAPSEVRDCGLVLQSDFAEFLEARET